MGIRLIVEVFDHAPADVTSAELVVLLAVAEQVNDDTREWTPEKGLVLRRSRLSPTGLRDVFQRLAERGLEVRVPLSTIATGKRAGKAVYSYTGRRTRFHLPHLGPVDDGCLCRSCNGDGPASPGGDGTVSPLDGVATARRQSGDGPPSPYPSKDPLLPPTPPLNPPSGGAASAAPPPDPLPAVRDIEAEKRFYISNVSDLKDQIPPCPLGCRTAQCPHRPKDQKPRNDGEVRNGLRSAAGLRWAGTSVEPRLLLNSLFCSLPRPDHRSGPMSKATRATYASRVVGRTIKATQELNESEVLAVVVAVDADLARWGR